MGPGDPFAQPEQTAPEVSGQGGGRRAPDRRLAVGFGLGALLGLSLWKLGVGATLTALVMGGLGMLVAARSEMLARLARALWDRFSYRFLR